MIRKLLKKLGWNDETKKPEEYTEKPTHENISQSVKKNKEPVNVSPPTNTKTYVNNSQPANESKEPTKVKHSDDTNSDLKANDWKTENTKKRQINVFVSSTFKDMQAERKELFNTIFPHLRKLCEQKSVTLNVVDLFGGIINENKTEGKVLLLPTCEAEMHNCNSYFIGILGERYGWFSDEIQKDHVIDFDRLNRYIGKSIVEDQILNGVLKNPIMEDHAFFYFRHPLYLKNIPDNEVKSYVDYVTVHDIIKYGPEESERRAYEKRKRLIELKKSIKNSGFPVRENYVSPIMLGELVYLDLKDVINRLYPDEVDLYSEEQTRFEHKTFAESLCNVYIDHIYIERRKYFADLDAHLENTNISSLIRNYISEKKIVFRCPSCKLLNEVSDAYAGIETFCLKCSRLYKIPTQSEQIGKDVVIRQRKDNLFDPYSEFYGPEVRHCYEYDFFISYANVEPDRNFARELAEKCTQNGWRIFYAPESLYLQNAYPEVFKSRWCSELEISLLTSCHLLCLISPAHLNSAYCDLELQGFMRIASLNNARGIILVLDEPNKYDVPQDLLPFVCENS